MPAISWEGPVDPIAVQQRRQMEAIGYDCPTSGARVANAQQPQLDVFDTLEQSWSKLSSFAKTVASVCKIPPSFLLLLF